MKLTDDEKKRILLDAGAEIVPCEEWTNLPLFENISDILKFNELPKEEQDQYYTPVPPEEVRICGRRPEDLVTFIMEDDSMYPDAFRGDVLYVAFREPLEDGKVFVVLVDDKIMIRRIFVRGVRLELVPENSDFSAKTYGEDEISILGFICGHSREL